ncbi:MAG: ABC-2 transporter permease, partial [Clostridiales bacterium]|nr:ABC-2 transporter permease [Clostridiales bacterium]
MNKTINFTKLDFITIKPYLSLKNLALFTAVFIFIGIGTSPATSIGMIMMFGLIYTTYPFAVGDKNGIDLLYATLPIKKSDIVVGRYFFAVMWNLLVAAVAVAASLVMVRATSADMSTADIFVTALVCFGLFSLIGAIQLPIYFKYGYAKA